MVEENTTSKNTLKANDCSATASLIGRPPSWTAACEAFIKQLLANRFIWLVFFCALYVNAQLTYIQWATARHGAQQFDTLDLMSHLLVVIELATLACLMIGFAAAGHAAARWYKRFPKARFPYFAYAVAIQLVAALVMLVQLVFLLYPHNYPQLRAEGINIPLMLLQRALLIYLALSISTQLAWLVRMYTRLPWVPGAFFILAVQSGIGYGTTLLSLKHDALVRLNSVFYHGYLWRYLPQFPNLQHTNLFHNIQMPYLGAYIGIGLMASLILTALWLPRAAFVSRRETLVHPSDSSS